MCDKPLSSENSPFAADHRRGDRLGRRPSRPLGCHAQMIQLPSNALLPELGQASLAVTLVGSSVANRFASQASAFNAEVLDMNRILRIPYHIYERSGGKLKRWVPELWTYLETTSPGII